MLFPDVRDHCGFGVSDNFCYLICRDGIGKVFEALLNVIPKVLAIDKFLEIFLVCVVRLIFLPRVLGSNGATLPYHISLVISIKYATSCSTIPYHRHRQKFSVIWKVFIRLRNIKLSSFIPT